MDPLTAWANLGAALFHFLSTPAGQTLCMDIRAEVISLTKTIDQQTAKQLPKAA
jgi:hypothetical protein